MKLLSFLDLSDETISSFSNINSYLPAARATITETGTLVVATRIRSEEIVVLPDELCVYVRCYGDESELEILFPTGAVERECCLSVQVVNENSFQEVSIKFIKLTQLLKNLLKDKRR